MIRTLKELRQSIDWASNAQVGDKHLSDSQKEVYINDSTTRKEYKIAIHSVSVDFDGNIVIFAEKEI